MDYKRHVTAYLSFITSEPKIQRDQVSIVLFIIYKIYTIHDCFTCTNITSTTQKQICTRK